MNFRRRIQSSLYPEPIGNQPCPHVLLTRPSWVEYAPVYRPNSHLPHDSPTGPQSKTEAPLKKRTLSVCPQSNNKRFVLTCQCPWCTELKSGRTPLRLGWVTEEPCSNSSRQTSSFPRPAAADNAGGKRRIKLSDVLKYWQLIETLMARQHLKIRSNVKLPVSPHKVS